MKDWYDCSIKDKIERWTQAVRVLRNLSPHERRKHWNMGEWGKKTECGTVACAAGHCAMDPWFRRRGFKLLPDSGCYVDYHCDPEGFFGCEGSVEIFYDTEPRPVSTVVKEMVNYIRFLEIYGDDQLAEYFNKSATYRRKAIGL